MRPTHITSVFAKLCLRCSCKWTTAFVAFLNHSSYLDSQFYHQQNRYFSSKPRFNFEKVRHPDDAVALFHVISRLPRRPSSAIYFNKLLSAVVKIKQYSLALHLFDKMLQRSDPVDPYTLAIAINCFCRVKRVDFGFSILGTHFKRGLAPDVVTFNNLIKGLVVIGKVSEAEKLYNKSLREKLCEPDIITCSTLIHGYCKIGEMDEARRIYNLAVDSGLTHVYCYSSLIDGYCKKGCIDEAWSLFLTVPARGLEHDVVSYSAMLRGFFRGGRFEDGMKLFIEMQAENFPADVVTYSIVLEGLCSARRIGEAYSLLHMMEDRGVIPNIITYNILINGLCKNQQIERAKDVFNELPSKGLHPDAVTLKILIGALCQGGRIEEAKDVMVQMGDKGCVPDRVTYNVFVKGLVRRKRKQNSDVMAALEEMERRGFTLCGTTSSVLIEHLEDEGGDDVLFEKVKKLLPNNL